eukprot:tig00001304_g8106.t1
MGKLKRDRAFRKAAETVKKAESSEDEANSKALAGKGLASRPTIEKKIRKKERLLAKIEENAKASGKAKAAIEESLTADLGTLEGALPEAKAKAATLQQKLNPPKPLSSKARQKLALAEITRFQAVLNHRAFKANPQQALGEHLKNVVDKVNGRIPGTAEAKAAEEEAKAAAAAAAAAKGPKGKEVAGAEAGGVKQARKAKRLPRPGRPSAGSAAGGAAAAAAAAAPGSGKKRKAGGEGMEVDVPSGAAQQQRRREERKQKAAAAKLTPEQRAKLALKSEKMAKVKAMRKDRRAQEKAQRRAGRDEDQTMADAAAPAAKRARLSA